MIVQSPQAGHVGILVSSVKAQSVLIGRRGELLAELFLQDLKPEFVARATENLGYDFFAGFRNPRGGINIIAVEVELTEQMTNNVIEIPRSTYFQWANSNIPVLLLVVDVKENDYDFAWPDPDGPDQHQRSKTIKVDLTRIDDKSRGELRDRLAA